MAGHDQLPLMVEIAADEWAYQRRRMIWLETMLLRLVRDRGGFREWYDAGELAALRLPGLPPTRTGIAQKARRDGWLRQDGKGRRGALPLFHVSSLPARAFDALVSRVLDLPPVDAELARAFDLPPVPTPDLPLPANTAPPWVLPLMRLMKCDTGGDLYRAWEILPAHVPDGTPLPDAEEAARVLIAFGLV